MSQPKLLMPWRDGRIIDSVLLAWTSSDVSEVVVVVREDDAELTDACNRWPVRVVHPSRETLDMKDSIQFGLRFVADEFQPSHDDRCFVSPADIPSLSVEIINTLIATKSSGSELIVPHFGDKPGHPVLFPWAMTSRIFDLGRHEGVNKLVEESDALAVRFPSHARVTDIDTPEDYRAEIDNDSQSNTRRRGT